MGMLQLRNNHQARLYKSLHLVKKAGALYLQRGLYISYGWSFYPEKMRESIFRANFC